MKAIEYSFYFILFFVVFNTLYNTDENVFLGATNGCGKRICAELGILRLFSNAEISEPKCVYITPKEELAEIVYQDWSEKFGKIDRKVVILTGETAMDLKLIAKVSLLLNKNYEIDLKFRVKLLFQHRKNGIIYPDDGNKENIFKIFIYL